MSRAGSSASFELVRNRAFNDGGANLTYWNAVGGAALSSDPSQYYGKLTRSLKMQISGSRAGVSNGGFWGKTAGWTTSSRPVSGVSGVHDVYLLFTDSLRLNWVQFLAAPAFTAANVTNGASFHRGIVPGSIATIFGAGLSSINGIARAALPLPRQLAGTTVTVNCIAAPLFALANVNGAEQVNLQVPFEIAGQATAQIVVTSGGSASQPVQVDVWPAQPGVFTADGFTGAVLHGTTYAPVTAANPAAKGEVVLIYATGLGDIGNLPATGAAADAARTVVPAEVTIAGTPALVSYSGLAPGFAGRYQLNVTVPADAPSGVASVVVTARGAVSQLVGLALQ